MTSCSSRARTAAAPSHVHNYRAAAKRRKARAKNHARIDQVRIGDDVFAQARHALVDQRQHQPVRQVAAGTVAVIHLQLHGLAIHPSVVALTGLAPEFFRRHQRFDALQRHAAACVRWPRQ